MADDITLDSMSGGSVVATDEVASRHFQLLKIAFGADGTANMVTSTTTNPFPVALSDTDNAVLDNIDSNTDYGAVTGGGTETGALRVTIANDSTGLLSVDDGGGSLTVDGSVGITGALPAGSNNIGDVDIASSVLPTGAATQATLADVETNTDFGAVTGGGTETGALRVTIANDSTGVVSIDDNGSSITVDGTVTETNSAAILADTANMDTNLGTVAGAVSGTEVQVDVVAALPAGSNNIGDVDIASIAAGDNNIGNVDIVTLPALPAGSNNIGDVDVASIAAGAALIGDVGLSGARTSGGSTPYRNIDVDETEDAIKASAGQIYWIHCVNIDATPVYLHFYNATTGTVVVGTTTPDLTFIVPSQGDANGAGFALSIPNGIEFDTAITVAATTTVGGTGGPGTNEVILNVGYA
jgi:hypothetical protein